jgi:hypothetical protein
LKLPRAAELAASERKTDNVLARWIASALPVRRPSKTSATVEGMSVIFSVLWIVGRQVVHEAKPSDYGLFQAQTPPHSFQ